MLKFFELCCIQPLCCAMCKKHRKYSQKSSLQSNAGNIFSKEFQSQRAGRFVEVHFGVSLEVLLDYFRGMLGWYGVGFGV